ncbi:MAG: Sapep family Mn(2+)-dependent dipeptidase [Oscillospiraceae bacterium]|nr:Sapep family Mn(2+)-dependent dipeptidase [Oscillospiraceae bacterium]
MLSKMNEYMRSNKDNMLSLLAELIEIPSVRGDATPGAPFGEEPKRALDKMLEICENMGLKTACCENVVGSADYAPDGSEVELGILCHLDVVPVEPANWSYPPFKLTEKDGILYGRGVIDDKGPAVAALYAIKCIKDLGIPLKKGVRFIFGTDEENGSGDMEIYMKHEKMPPCVFTPDGSFPVINVEKGMMRSFFKGGYDGGSVRCFHGGSIPNAVPDKAYAEVLVSLDAVNNAIAEDKSGAVFTVEDIGGAVKISADGKSAHASTPEAGINAVTALISLINRLGFEGSQADILKGLEKAFPCGETDAESVGLKAQDKTGATTIVFSIFDMENGECSGVVDVRFPTCLDLKTVEEKERAAFAAAGCELDRFMGDEPHCVDEDSEFVQALLRVYERVEGEKGRCIAIGGGTYVHHIDGGVAFGVERGDTDYHMHGADEFFPVEELLRDAVMFAAAIVEICG